MGFSYIRTGGLLAAVIIFLSLQGCATSAQKSAGMRNMLHQGRADLALREVEKQGQTDDVMVNMNLGMLRRMTGDYRGSNVALEAARKKIEELYATSITEQAGAMMINDETISFQGERFEQVLIHAYKALNYIDLGNLDAARVEILQADVKMMEWGDSPEEDPFMRYLAGIIYEALGERDDALISYRKALEAYRRSRQRQGFGVPEQLKQDLLRLLAQGGLRGELERYRKEFGMSSWQMPDTRGKGELVVIMNNGLAPQRQQRTFQTYSTELAYNIRVAVPAYLHPPAYVNPVRLTVDGQQEPLETVENIDGLARAALEKDMPVITARAIARAVVKKKSEKEAGKSDSPYAGLAQLAMLVVNTATEIADTRGWNTLPQEVQLARVMLPPGQHQLSLEVLGRSGRVLDRYDQPVTIRAGRKTIIARHWTAPRPVSRSGTQTATASSVKAAP
jgi:hypothetical protein